MISEDRIRIAVSCGDINGVGLEVFVKALSAISPHDTEFTLYIHGESAADYLQVCDLSRSASLAGNTLSAGGHSVTIAECDHKAAVTTGNLTAESGTLAFESLRRGIQATIDGRHDAIVTLPISKHALHLAGARFPGQTELLGSMCSVPYPLMILSTEGMRVTPATIHVPLRNVSDSITIPGLERHLYLFARALQEDFGVAEPAIAVLALNPHAGEDGAIGKEEQRVISPALDILRQKGLSVDGPFAADGFFAHGSWRRYDGIVSMYHDQGLIPLKMTAKDGGVNITAGLPIVRTSPDHGTAFAIAGKNVADEASTVAAIRSACSIVANRRKFKSPVTA